MKPTDLIGTRFGRLVVNGPLVNGRTKSESKWPVICDCGTALLVWYYDLLREDDRARTHCGCQRAPRKHGFARKKFKEAGYSPEYRCWMVMRARCNNPNVDAYHRYGGRGIRVCARWDNFENFLADMGPKPGRHFTIERKKRDEDYEPNNCIWLHRSKQSSNTCRNHMLDIGGQIQTVAEWSRISGRPVTTIHQRLNRGWPPYRAVFDAPRW